MIDTFIADRIRGLLLQMPELVAPKARPARLNRTARRLPWPCR